MTDIEQNKSDRSLIDTSPSVYTPTFRDDAIGVKGFILSTSLAKENAEADKNVVGGIVMNPTHSQHSFRDDETGEYGSFISTNMKSTYDKNDKLRKKTMGFPSFPASLLCFSVVFLGLSLVCHRFP